MKLFIFALVVSTVLLMAIFGGLLGANPSVTMLGFCSFSGFFYPLLWVAVYRFWSHFSRKYQVIQRRG